MKKKIAVLVGGYSHEAQISLKSGETVIENIDENKYDVYKIVVDEKSWTGFKNGHSSPVDKNDFSLTFNSEKVLFDAAFIVIHGTPGEDGKLQAYFEMIGIPFNTCGSLASAITFNKFTCNSLLKHFGIRCAESIVIRKNDAIIAKDIANKLGYPMFVKPCDGGSSFGVTKVKEEKQIEKAVKEALQHGTEVVIESFINGVEVTCGIFRVKEKTTVLQATEIVSKNEFFDFEAKYKGHSEEITPARISAEMMKEIQGITQQVYELLNLKGLSRIDFIIQDNVPYLIEVNTVPGLSAQSIIPQQAKFEGITLKNLFSDLIEESLRSK